MTEDYQPLQDLTSALKSWPLILFFTLLGVAAAWGFSRLNPPWFEARAEIAINVDLHRTGTLTGENQDILVNTAGKIIASAPILDALYLDAQAEGFKGGWSDFERIIFSERKAESFILRVQHPDAQLAYHLADQWTGYALSALEKAEQHAIEADAFQRYLDGLVDCLRQVSSYGVSSPLCTIDNVDVLQQEIVQTQGALVGARMAARGYTPGMRFSLVQPAFIQPYPVQYRQNGMLLAGALIGLILSLLVIHFSKADSLFQGRQRG